MLAYGIPFIPAGIFAFILNWSDRYFLRIYSDLETIGLYSLGYRMGMIIVMLIANPFTLVWNAYLFEIEKQSTAKQVYARVATYFVLALCSVGLVISIFARELIVIIAQPSYLNAYTVIPLIVLSMIFMCSDNVFQVGLLIRGKSGYIALSRGLAGMVNLGLNFVLIPGYGMLGAALSTAISFFIYAVAIFYFAQRIYYIDFEFSRLLKVALTAFIVFWVSLFVSTDDLRFSIITKLGILCLYPALLFLFKFLEGEETVFLKTRLTMLWPLVLRKYKF